VTTSERDILLFHGLFAAASAVLLVPWPAESVGWALLALVMGYNAALPGTAVWRGHADWLHAWTFLLPLSVLQVLPDWFLAAVIHTLSFPETGGPRIGAVPVYMAGMWVVPLFLAVAAGEALRKRHGRTTGVVGAGLAALAIFAASEALAWRIPIWHAHDVTAIAGIALYVLPPELVLGAGTYGAFLAYGNGRAPVRLACAGALMLIYLGGLALAYLLIEHVLFGGTT